MQPWLPALYRFFDEFPSRLAETYGGELQPPALWKTLGDEMVFVAELKHHLQVAEHVCRFRDTIAAYREVIKDASRKLDLKGAAWLAGFPVGNTALTLHRGLEGNAAFEDFLGPSIDNGFRLSKHATPRKFVLSVETAYMLLASARPKDTEVPDVFLERGEELKGVLGGRPYPKLWIAIPYRQAEDFRKLEERLLDPPGDHKEKDLRDYCELFIREHGNPLFLPFIEGDEIFGKHPPGYDEQYEEVKELWANEMGEHLKHEPTVHAQAPPAPTLERQIALLGSKVSAKKQKRRSADARDKKNRR